MAQDDPVQSPRATHVVERRLSEEEPGFLSVVVMSETAWVLERAYRLDDRAIAAAIERVLQADVVVVESEQEVFAAMTALKEGCGAFADALIGALAERAGCSATLTFDQRALRLQGSRPP
jgi:predicted nucleic-acid-binding protein